MVIRRLLAPLLLSVLIIILGTLGYRFIGGPPRTLATYLKTEIAKWARVAASADLVSR